MENNGGTRALPVPDVAGPHVEDAAARSTVEQAAAGRAGAGVPGQSPRSDTGAGGAAGEGGPGVARTPEPRAETVRERILSTARELFYRDGARAVGVDTVVARSGVAKTSLYRWFPSKDALIVAVLEAEARDRWTGWDRIAARAPAEPRERLRAMLAGIVRYVSSERYRGCPFMNVTVEFPDAQHPARCVALETSEELRRRVRSLVDPLGVPEPGLLSDQLLMLIEGAFSAAQVFGAQGPQHQLVATADALVQAQLSSR